MNSAPDMPGGQQWYGHFHRSQNVSRKEFLIEYGRPISIQEHAIVEVPADRPRKNDFLEVAFLLHQVPDRIPMGDADNVLLHDGPAVQHFRDVMRGGAEQLDAPLANPCSPDTARAEWRRS